MASSTASLSVVIPTLNEEQGIGPAVQACFDQGAFEVLVVDGGSADATVERAQAMGGKVLHGQRGRALQMNAGAREAQGHILLFLHADSILLPGSIQAIHSTLEAEHVQGGSLRMRLDEPGIRFRLTEILSNARARFLRLPYGDQGIFVRRSVFHEMQGFLEVPLLEDLEFSARLRKKGALRVVPGYVLSSARRFKAEGFWKVNFRNWWIALAYGLGASPEKLARLYGPPVR